MVDADTLMRFIRIFSELSNQIRYASQKRVLVEIALIKLCRPSMETNMDSVLDRIRVMEDKIEQGIVARPASGSRQAAVNGAATQTIPEAPKVKPRKAAPEDLQQVKTQWRTIVGQTQGMFKTFLHTSVPKYNGQTGEPKLYVEFTNTLAQNYVDNPEAKKELEDLIVQKIGKYVEVEFLLTQSSSVQGLAEISVDDILESKIHMDVVIEDE